MRVSAGEEDAGWSGIGETKAQVWVGGRVWEGRSGRYELYDRTHTTGKENCAFMIRVNIESCSE